MDNNNINGIDRSRDVKDRGGRKVSRGRGSSRVVISNEANFELEKMVGRVSDGYSAGKITKSDLANYMFLNIDKLISESDLKSLKELHFDDKMILSTLLKRPSEIPKDIKDAIRSHFGVSKAGKRKTS